MEIKKNDKFTVTIEDMGEDGAGIGRVDGYIWFVKDALIGDTIEASAMKMKKNYGFARLVRVITPAKGRVEAKCPVARACGGCQLQELDYKEQLKFKEKKVYNHLKRIGGHGKPVPAGRGGTGSRECQTRSSWNRSLEWKTRGDTATKRSTRSAAEKTENRRLDSLPDGPTP